MEYCGIDIIDGKYKRITVSEGFITDIRVLSEVEDNTRYLSPTFTDMQVNGYMGVDYSGDDLTEDGILFLIKELSRSGTFRHVPTIITNSEERILKNLSVISNACNHNPIIRNAIIGIHIEGPFISSKDGPRGAHDPLYVRELDIEEVKRWQRAGQGLVKIITIAPEKNGAVPFIRKVTDMGINVAIGHAEPSEKEVLDAVDAGARLSTHLGNGSSAMLPRLKNHIWVQTAEDRLIAGIISDGFHLPRSVVKTIYRTKGIDNIILVSDVALLGGMKPGLAKWGNIDVEICQDGHLSLAGTSLLAGAGHLLDWDIAKFMSFTGAGIKEAIKTVTVNPNRVLGAYINSGYKVGDRADILSFDIGDERLEIEKGSYGELTKGDD